jgi:polar amino acid transport system substrate-binding protein
MPAGSFMEKILARQRLIVGVDPSTQQFSARNQFTGQLEGFDIDLLHQVSNAIFGDPNKIEYHVINYAQRIPSLQNNTVDVVADTMTINCARWQLIDFSSEYLHAGQRVMVRNDSTLASIQQMAAAHTRVCAARGSTNYDNLQKNYPAVQILPVDNLATCLVLFQQDAVEVVTADDTVLAGFVAQDPYAKIVGPEFTDEPYGLGVSKSHPEFVQFINALLERLRADGTWKAMYAKWLAVKGTPIPDPPPAVYGRPPPP